MDVDRFLPKNMYVHGGSDEHPNIKMTEIVTSNVYLPVICDTFLVVPGLSFLRQQRSVFAYFVLVFGA